MLGFPSLKIAFRFPCAVALFIMFAVLAHQHSALKLEKQQYNKDPDDINVIPEMGQLKIKKSRVIRAGGDKVKKRALPSTINKDDGKTINLNETIEAMNSLLMDGKVAKTIESISSSSTKTTDGVESKVTIYTKLLNANFKGEHSAAFKLHRLSFTGSLFALIGAIFLVFP